MSVERKVQTKQLTGNTCILQVKLSPSMHSSRVQPNQYEMPLDSHKVNCHQYKIQPLSQAQSPSQANAELFKYDTHQRKSKKGSKISSQQNIILKHRRSPAARVSGTDEQYYQKSKDQQIAELKTIVELLSSHINSERSQFASRTPQREKSLAEEVSLLKKMLEEQRKKSKYLLEEVQKQKQLLLSAEPKSFNLSNTLLEQRTQGSSSSILSFHQTEALRTNAINILDIQSQIQLLKQDVVRLKNIITQQRLYISQLQLEIQTNKGSNQYGKARSLLKNRVSYGRSSSRPNKPTKCLPTADAREDILRLNTMGDLQNDINQRNRDRRIMQQICKT